MLDARDRPKTRNDTAWIALFDSRRGRLLEASRTPQGRRHLEERADLAETWEEKQHFRPSMLAGKGRSHASFRHEAEERIHRFARQASGWLAGEVKQRGIEALPVFCSKALLGPMREAVPPGLGQRVVFHAQDLVWLTLAELVEHPAVQEALSAPP